MFINQRLHLVCCHRLEPSFSLQLETSTRGDSPYQNERGIASNRLFYWQTFANELEIDEGICQKGPFSEQNTAANKHESIYDAIHD